MRFLRLLARHTADHAAMILVAAFVLLVTTATSACKRGPVLDMRGNGADADPRAIAVALDVEPRPQRGERADQAQWTSEETTCSRSGRKGAIDCVAR